MNAGNVEHENPPMPVVYPNPNGGYFTVLQAEAKETPYTITDVTGRIIKTGKLKEKNNSIEIPGHRSGFYFLNVNGRIIKLMLQ